MGQRVIDPSEGTVTSHIEIGQLVVEDKKHANLGTEVLQISQSRIVRNYQSFLQSSPEFSSKILPG